MASFKSLALLALVTISVVADEPMFLVGYPMVFGSGCSTMSTVTVASGVNQLVIYFSELHAQTKPDVFREKITCDVTVPVFPRKGLSIGVARVEYKGRYLVPLLPFKFGWSATFEAAYTFADQDGPKSKSSYYMNYFHQTFLVTEKLRDDEITWSQCDTPATNLHVVSSVTATGVDGENQVDITVTSEDVISGFYYYFVSREC